MSGKVTDFGVQALEVEPSLLVIDTRREVDGCRKGVSWPVKKSHVGMCSTNTSRDKLNAIKPE